MADNLSIEEFNNQVVTARLLGGKLVIPTGSPDPKVWPRRTRFNLGEGYVAINDDRAGRSALASHFQPQYDKINDLANMVIGRGFTHGWVAPEGAIKGRSFMFIVGELHAPQLIWKRLGAGTQVYNQIFFNNEKLSVDEFLNQ